MEEEKKPSIKFGIIMAVIMTLLLGLFSVIQGRFAVTEAWAGYLFFWFWSSVRGFDFASLKKDIPSTAVGIGLGYVMFYIYNNIGVSTFEIIVMITLAVILFFSVTKLLPYIFGEATFLFFTVLTGNTMLTQAHYGQIAVSYLSGVVFFAATLGLTLKLLTRNKKQINKVGGNKK